MNKYRKYKDSYSVKRLINIYVKKHKTRLFIAIICILVISASTAFQVKILQPLIDKALGSNNISYLVIISLLLLFTGVLRAFGMYINSIFMQKINFFVLRDIQLDIYKSLIKSDISYLEKNGTSRHMTRFTTDLANIGELINNFFVTFVKESLTTIFMLGVMFGISPIMTIAAFVIIPVFLIPIIKLAKKLELLYLENFEQAGLMSSTIDDTLKGVREVKSYNIHNFVINWVGEHFNKIANLSYKGSRYASMSRPIMELSISLMMSLGTLWGGYMVVKGKLTVGALISFYTALIAVQKPLKALANLNITLKSGIASLKRIYEIIDKEPRIKDIKNAKELVVKKGEIQIQNVNFTYEKNNYILENINIDIPAGSSVAIVGSSGSGKSSLINLINRFTDVTSGKIKIDGIDIKTVTQESLHKNIAVVGQNPSLFNTTIRENLLFGNLEATDYQLIEALKQASAWDFVRNSKKGLNTLVGERGLQLSGGQRQRISIARAFLKSSPILILDEATSALDTKSEKEILKTLYKLKQGRTTITIAHRISTIMNADKIFVLQDGHIVESGTHKQLKSKNGIYSELSRDIK